MGGIALQQLLAKPGIEFDALKIRYIGVPAQDSFIIGVHKSTGITDVNSWIASKQMVKFGGIGPGAGSDDIPKISRHETYQHKLSPATKAPQRLALPSTTAKSKPLAMPGNLPSRLGATNSTRER